MSVCNLITSYTFQEHQYLIKMNSTSNYLELILTDKQSGEEWECSYDVAYIENITRKTGNFKQFNIFIVMLKSGLLKTSDCIALDLFTYEDLESLRLRKLRSQSSSRLFANNNNRRYLIVTYTVEFDRINYPLPLEYTGPPDPMILQSTIRKLESDLRKAHEKLEMKSGHHERERVKVLQKRMEEIKMENRELRDEVKRLTKMINKKPETQVQMRQKTIAQLERNLIHERNSHHRLAEKLQNDKMQLEYQLEKLKSSEKTLKAKLQAVTPRQYVLTPLRTNRASELPRQQRKSSLSPSPRCVKQQFQTERSRSASPRVMLENDWSHVKNRRSSSTRSKSRSRSSSLASTKKSEQLLVLPSSASSGDSARRKKNKKQKPYYTTGSTTSASDNSAVAPNKSKKHFPSPVSSKHLAPSIGKLDLRIRKSHNKRQF